MISVRENRRNCLFCLHNLDPAVAPLAKQILGVFHVLLTEISCKIWNHSYFMTSQQQKHIFVATFVLAHDGIQNVTVVTVYLSIP